MSEKMNPSATGETTDGMEDDAGFEEEIGVEVTAGLVHEGSMLLNDGDKENKSAKQEPRDADVAESEDMRVERTSSVVLAEQESGIMVVATDLEDKESEQPPAPKMKEKKETITVKLALSSVPTFVGRLSLQISATQTTATSLRESISETTKIPVKELILIYGGHVIPDSDADDVVAKFGLDDDSVIHCMGKPLEEPKTHRISSLLSNENDENSVVPPSSPPQLPSTSSSTSFTPAGEDDFYSHHDYSNATSPSHNSDLEGALLHIRAAAASYSSGTVKDYNTALETLQRILLNIQNHPHEPKYRRIKPSNPAFHKRFGKFQGSLDALVSVGFQPTQDADGNPCYELKPSKGAWTQLVAAKSIVDRAVEEGKKMTDIDPVLAWRQTGDLGASSTKASPILVPATASSRMEEDGVAVATARTTSQHAAVERMLSDTIAIKSMLQNPLVAQTVKRNPEMKPLYENLLNNPGMLEAVSENILRHPDILSQALGLGKGDSHFLLLTKAMSGSSKEAAPTSLAPQMSIPDTIPELEPAPPLAARQPTVVKPKPSSPAPAPPPPAQSVNAAPSFGSPSFASSSQHDDGEEYDASDYMTEDEMVAAAIARSLSEK